MNAVWHLNAVEEPPPSGVKAIARKRTRTAPAPYNEYRWEWRSAYSALRRFSRRAIHFLDRVSGAPRGYCYPVKALAHRAYDVVLTEEYLYSNGTKYEKGEGEACWLEFARTHEAVTGRGPHWCSNDSIQLTVAGKPTPRVWAWGCGQLAIHRLRALFDRTWLPHAPALVRGDLLPPRESGGPARVSYYDCDEVMNFAANLIGARLLERDAWVAGAEE